MSHKVVLITGAARRVGAQIARHLHQSGWQVILHYHRSETQAQQLLEALLSQRADSACLLQADLSDLQQLSRLAQQAEAVWGRLDALVNNASIFYPKPVEQVTSTDWQTIMDCNLRAPFFLSQAVYPALRAQQGCIVNLGDANCESQTPVRQYDVYNMSKAGLAMMTCTLAKSWGPSVRVNAVAPGAVCWPEGEAQMSQAMRDKVVARATLERSGTPQDVAQAVSFLVNDADYITGQILRVDGGRF